MCCSQGVPLQAKLRPKRVCSSSSRRAEALCECRSDSDVDAARQARAAAEAALQAEQKRFENGQSTSFVLLQVQTALTQGRVAELGALAGDNIALAQLALQEGTTLERHNINLRIE